MENPPNPSYELPTALTTSTGVILQHEDTGGVIITSAARSIHLTDAAWRELVQYAMSRFGLTNEDAHERAEEISPEPLHPEIDKKPKDKNKNKA